MVDVQTFRELAFSLPDVVEVPHFDRPSFRVKKKIFATYHPDTNRAMLKLPLPDQSVFCNYDNRIFYPVPGAWGAKGATYVELSKVRKDMFRDALDVAYQGVITR